MLLPDPLYISDSFLVSLFLNLFNLVLSKIFLAVLISVISNICWVLTV
jgi:hypothetical protein